MLVKNCTYSYVDKKHPLNKDYIPNDLVVAPLPFVISNNDPRCLIRATMYFPLRSLYYASKDDGISIYGVCGYLSYKKQQDIYYASIRKHGLSYTRKSIEYPGTSEHQTGLVVDVTSPSNDFKLNENFAHTDEYLWLTKNAERFGFSLPYTDKICFNTGHNYEPWHLRFTCNKDVYCDMI